MHISNRVQKKGRLLAYLILLSVILAGCGRAPAQDSSGDNGSGPLARSSVQRDTSPELAEPALEQLAAGNRAFAVDLYQAVRLDAELQDNNLFFSPYSISSALAMVYGGARGNTEQQMADVLHYTLPQDQLHPAFNALDLSLADPKQDDFTLKIANSAWAQEGFAFLPAYLDLIASNYGAGIRLVEYMDAGAREQARQAINDWVSEQTEEKIKDLIPDGVLTQDTRLVLANAVYFKAEWETPFSTDTRDAPFHLLDGTTVEAPLMSRRAPASYSEGDGYQAVGLAYKGERMQMVVILPAEGQFEAIEGSLDPEFIDTVLNGLKERGNFKLYLPKYSFEAELGLKDTLIEMGMPDAFTEGPVSDFSGMTEGDVLYLSDALHKAFVAVNELGTEAAAATGAVAEIESLPLIVRVDRPFIFFIHDRETGTILFLGRVLNPLE